MADLHILIETHLPEKMYGGFEQIIIHKLSQAIQISIEDYLFSSSSSQVRLSSSGLSVITISDLNLTSENVDDLTLAAEFGLTLIATEGHPSIIGSAIFSDGKCMFANVVPSSQGFSECKFAHRINALVVAQWLRRCLLARKNLKDRFHVTAHRYVKYAKSKNDPDALLDLCISLESLLDSSTEIGFRFSTCLSKVTGVKATEAKVFSEILSDLYDLRSKIVHGDHEAGKLMKKLGPRLPDLDRGAKRVLTTYIFYLSEHSRKEWKDHLRNCLFS
jgi:hypothetical protein